MIGSAFDAVKAWFYPAHHANIDENAAQMARSLLDHLSAAGFAVVPKNPTKAMLAAVAHADWMSKHDVNWRDGYKIMLSAAEPQP